MTAAAPRRPVRRALLVQLAAVGDIVLCTPAVRRLRQAYPDARIDFLSSPAGADALGGNPHLDEILVYREPLRERVAMIREIRRRGYDTVVDFHSNPRTAQVVAFSGAPVRVGFRGRGPRNLAYTHLLHKERIPGSYSAWRKVDMLEALGVPVGPDADVSLEIALGEAERRGAEQIWRQLGLADGRPVVAISGVSRDWRKKWAPERWAAVADELVEAGARVFLSHGPGEREQVEAVARRMRHPAAWDYPPSTIRQLAALYQRCALWVGNDGGPKHIAVAAGLPTITVIRWPQGTIWTDVSQGSPHRFFEREPVQGCDQRCHLCDHVGCLDAVTLDEVRQAALSALHAVAEKDRAR